MKRAYDTIDKEFVFRKLSIIGFREPEKKWMLSFLKDSKFSVLIKNRQSDIFNTCFGTPRGSILGTLLFILLINDRPEYITQEKHVC